MTPEEKLEHDVKTAEFTQKLREMSPEGVLMSALGILILHGRISKYDLPPQEAATVFELLHRADPSFTW